MGRRLTIACELLFSHSRTNASATFRVRGTGVGIVAGRGEQPRGRRTVAWPGLSGRDNLRARVWSPATLLLLPRSDSAAAHGRLSIALSLIVRLGQCRLWVRPALRNRRSRNAAARALLSLSREFALVDDCRLHWLSDTLTDCRARWSRRSARRPSTCPGDPAVSRAHRRRCC